MTSKNAEQKSAIPETPDPDLNADAKIEAFFRKQPLQNQPVALFKVRTIIAKFAGSRDVSMRWIASGRKQPQRWYAEAVAGYTPGDAYAELWVDELFTAEEANELLRYLRAQYPSDSHNVEGVILPALDSPFPISAMSTGGPCGEHILWWEQGYDLPFKVVGRYDLRDHELLPDRASDLERRKAFVKDTFFIMPGGKVICAADLEKPAPLH